MKASSETADDGHARGDPTVDVVRSTSTTLGARIVETIAQHNNKKICSNRRRQEEEEQQQVSASGATTTTASTTISPSESFRSSSIQFGDPISIRRYPLNTIKLFFINGYSAMLVFVLHLITLESLFSILLSVIMTICKCFYIPFIVFFLLLLRVENSPILISIFLGYIYI